MKPPTKREYLRDLVADKNRWSGRQLTDEELALGFLGWHERGYLPHCDFPGLVQFVTFRLEDSMPAARRSEWEHLLTIEDLREKRTKLEKYLDQGIGECWLRDYRVAGIAEESLLHFHNQRYELLAWCVMPNHVHALVVCNRHHSGKSSKGGRFTWRMNRGIRLRRSAERRLGQFQTIATSRGGARRSD